MYRTRLREEVIVRRAIRLLRARFERAFVSRAVWIYESERGKKPRIITMNVVIDSILRFKDRSVFTRLSKSI